MALSLTAEQKSIFDLFSGKDQYIIPPYQRPYAWGSKHCRVLFDDLTHAYFHQKDEGYFLGNLVISQNNRDRNSLEVIDGQQRLTTLILLIKVLLLFDETNDDLKNAINIPSSRRGGETKSRLKTTVFMEKDSDFLQEALALDLAGEGCKETASGNRFKKNICYFYHVTKEFSTRNDIQNFIDFLMFDIYFLPIVIEGDDPDKARKKALTIFETINDRGLNLSTADILKAKLYSLALNELKHEDFIEKWKCFSNECTKINYSTNDVFRVYSLIVRGESGIVAKEISLRSFFVDGKQSPFNRKKYSEIMNELFKIVLSIKLTGYIEVNPDRYGEITKWFQILKLLRSKFYDVLIVFLYRYSIENEKDLVYILKKSIRLEFQHVIHDMKYDEYGNENIIYEEGRKITYKIISIIMHSDIYHYRKKIKAHELYQYTEIYNVHFTYYTYYHESLVLLFTYLNEKNKAIYPYYSYKVKKDFAREIGQYIITNYPAEDDEGLKESTVEDTKRLIKKISGKSDEDVLSIISRRTEKMKIKLNEFLAEDEEKAWF